MNSLAPQNPIISYNAEELNLEVKVENETVWLTQAQIAQLFDCSTDNISLHLKNVFEEQEVDKNLTTEHFSVVRFEGNRNVQRKILHYNLDAILSVGYRVKSFVATRFRIWANSVLKDYLLKGYAIHSRIDNLERKYFEHDKQIAELVQTALPPKQGIYFDGQIFDAYIFVNDIIKSAKNSIILFDNYIDENTLTLFSDRNENVEVTIYTKPKTKKLILDLEKHNLQYPKILINEFENSHDRFLIIDKTKLYHIGASLKDLGKKWFCFSSVYILLIG